MEAVFNDPATEPTPALIRAALGAAGDTWEDLYAMLTGAGVSAAWRYYRDGGWLAKATKGSKTVAWLQINQGYTRITCYFAQRHREILTSAADLPQALRHQIGELSQDRKFLPVSLEVRTRADTAVAAVVVDYKQTLK